MNKRRLPPRVQYLVMRYADDGTAYATLDGLAVWNKQSSAIAAAGRKEDPENYDVIKYVRAPLSNRTKRTKRS